MVTHFIDKDDREEKVEHLCNLGPFELHMYQSFSANYNDLKLCLLVALQSTLQSHWAGLS